MPRTGKGRGGPREGVQGRQYPNRADMRQNAVPVSAPTGQPYGVRKEQVDAQRALPIAAPPTPVASQAGSVSLAPTPTPPLPFNRESDRPDIPITAGLPTGPGAGPEVLGMEGDDSLAVLRAAYQKYGNPDLLRIILDEDARRGL